MYGRKGPGPQWARGGTGLDSLSRYSDSAKSLNLGLTLQRVLLYRVLNPADNRH